MIYARHLGLQVICWWYKTLSFSPEAYRDALKRSDTVSNTESKSKHIPTSFPNNHMCY